MNPPRRATGLAVGLAARIACALAFCAVPAVADAANAANTPPVVMPPPVRSASIDLARDTVFYRHAGEGRPVVFVHALLIDSRLWLDQLEGLCAQRRCLAPDFTGFGFSSRLRGETASFEHYADELLEFLDRVGVNGPVDIVALSAGGNIAAAAYLKRPARFRSMVLISTAFGGGGVLDAAAARYRAENARNVVIEGKDVLFRRFNEYIVAPDASLTARARYKTMIEQTPYESLVTFFNTTDFGSSPSLPGALALPVMLPVGSGDTVVTAQGAQKLATQLPDAQLVRVEAAGRLLPLEAPAALNAAVLKFWSDLDARGVAPRR